MRRISLSDPHTHDPCLVAAFTAPLWAKWPHQQVKSPLALAQVALVLTTVCCVQPQSVHEHNGPFMWGLISCTPAGQTCRVLFLAPSCTKQPTGHRWALLSGTIGLFLHWGSALLTPALSTCNCSPCHCRHNEMLGETNATQHCLPGSAQPDRIEFGHRCV